MDVTDMANEQPLGAKLADNGECTFSVWAPRADSVQVHVIAPTDLLLPLDKVEGDYYQASYPELSEGTTYKYRLDGQNEYPDPASRFQPDGVHGPSMIMSQAFPWEDAAWKGLTLEDYITYELHVGTYTAEGNFEAVISHLDELADLGITAIELMPVSQFPGSRNWGYDGAFPFAVQNSYGGPKALKSLVNECHKRGIAAILDVVYNHLGPEGNYLEQYGYYFTDRYHTTWGKALNFDGAHSDEVRRFFLENACTWVSDFHFDALRLDALHAIVDSSSYTFVEELSATIDEIGKRTGRKIYLIGESDANNRLLTTERKCGGYGIHAQWNEGFHHALHALLTGEREGYYQDFGQIAHLASAFREGFVYSGQYSPYRKRRHGTSSNHIPAARFVSFSQNHDQVGNRMLGERLTSIVPFESLKLAAGAVLLSPYLPLVFMGEEWGETAPFCYFTSHIDPALVKAVRQGRKNEFSAFAWQGEVPDPQDEVTFVGSRPNHSLKEEGKHAILLSYYRELIRLRREVPALRHLSKKSMEVLGYENKKLLCVRRWHAGCQTMMLCNFGENTTSIGLAAPVARFKKRIDSADSRWLGNGSDIPSEMESQGEMDVTVGPRSLVLFTT